ncbi:MAG TPA: SGNH/GDSL hydrolase family protein [Cryobacterium sp.]|nr:SGNH/GDSL hydrolase family protein [Cryobacterium sp.]
MARTPLILDGLNLNDGTVYGYLPGAELGARQKTWNERKSYTGVVAQYNVSEAASIPMKFPMMVQGSSLADLDTKVRRINARLDGCSSASPKALVFAGAIYQIVTTPRVSYALDEAAISLFRATFDLVLNRTTAWVGPSLVPSFSLPALSSQVICDGNSMTIGHPWEEPGSLDPTAPYPAQLQALLGDTWLVRNDGVDSQDIDSMIADAATQIDPLYDANRMQNVVVCWEGTNEIYFHDDGASAAAKLAYYCTTRKAAGFKVVILTVLPRSGSGVPADFETQRGICNTAIRANWRTYADALCDVAADPLIGDAGDEMNTTYYPDRVHLTKAGYGIIAAAVQGSLATIPALSDGWQVYSVEAPNTLVTLEGTFAAPVQRLRLSSGNGLSGKQYILYALSGADSLLPGDSVTLDAQLKGSSSGVVVKLAIYTRSVGPYVSTPPTETVFSAAVTLTSAWQDVSVTIPSCAALTDYADGWVVVQSIDNADSFDVSVKDVTLRVSEG